MLFLKYLYSSSFLFTGIFILVNFNYKSDPNLIGIMFLILSLVSIATGIYSLVETIIKQIKKEMKEN